MKKIVFITAILASAVLNSHAQPNGGFENWSPEYSYETPDQWQTHNFLSLTSPPNPLSAFKAIGIDVHSGNYALKLKTIYVVNNPLPNTLNDTVSGAFTGKVNFSPISYKLGYPFTGRPEKLEFWAKSLPVGDDSAGASVILLKWNGISRDTIGGGRVTIFATSAYSLFQLNITYQSAELPDSASIFFGSSKKSEIARVGSVLFVDDVAFKGWVGIEQYDLHSDKVKVFPNPATDHVTIHAQIEEACNVKVFNTSGKLAGIYKIQNNNVNINTSLFTPAVYLYEITNNKDKVLCKGKFSVIN